MSNTYPIKHWLATILIGPLLPYMYQMIFIKEGDMGDLQLIPLFLTFGIFLSIPVFIAYYFAFKALIRRVRSILFIKTVLNAFIVIGVFVTFQIISGSLALPLSISYSIAAVLTSLFIKVRNDNNTVYNNGF